MVFAKIQKITADETTDVSNVSKPSSFKYFFIVFSERPKRPTNCPRVWFAALCFIKLISEDESMFSVLLFRVFFTDIFV